MEKDTLIEPTPSTETAPQEESSSSNEIKNSLAGSNNFYDVDYEELELKVKALSHDDIALWLFSCEALLQIKTTRLVVQKEHLSVLEQQIEELERKLMVMRNLNPSLLRAPAGSEEQEN